MYKKGCYNIKRLNVTPILEKNNYIILSEYVDSKKRRRLILKSKEGFKHDILVSSVSRGHLPYLVHRDNPFSIDNIKLWIKLNREDLILCDGQEYDGAFSKLKFYHKDCNNYIFINWTSLTSGRYCPVCSGQIVSDSNRLSLYYPKLALEWHPVKNGNVKPSDVSMGSDKKVWWICDKGHEYQAVVKSRAKGTSCKKCSDEVGQSLVALELKKYCVEKHKGIEEYSPLRNPATGYPLYYDIYIPKYKLYIEINGRQHYENNHYFGRTHSSFLKSKLLDRIKRTYAKKNGIYLEIDLRKIKSTSDAINITENVIGRIKQ